MSTITPFSSTAFKRAMLLPVAAFFTLSACDQVAPEALADAAPDTAIIADSSGAPPMASSTAAPSKSIRTHTNLTTRLYASTHRAGKRGVLGIAVRGEVAHIGYGTTNSKTATLPILVNLTTGEAYTVRTDGRREPLPKKFEDRRAGFDAAVFKMRTEGVIPAATDRNVVYLDHDQLTSGTEVYTFADAGAPRTQRIAGVGHNRDIAAAGRYVVAHTTGLSGGLWPNVMGSADGGTTWQAVRAPAGASFGANSFIKMASFRGRVYGWSAILGTNPAPQAWTVDGDLNARALWTTPEAYWPSNASSTLTFMGVRSVTWPQVHAGFETTEGLYLTTTNGTFFTPDPERTRPVKIGNPSGTGPIYASHGGAFYALAGGKLMKRVGTSWRDVTPLSVGFSPRHMAFSSTGALVVTGMASNGDIALASVPAASMRTVL